MALADQVCENCAVLVKDGRIAALGALETAACRDPVWEWEADLAGDWLIPGLIDIHVHGAGGFDTMDGTDQAMRTLGHTLLAEGTVAFLPTTMSSPPDALNSVLESIHAAQGDPDAQGAEILGVHMEGPFLSLQYKGAQAGGSLYPSDRNDAAAILESLAKRYPGLIRVLTLAVERPDFAELARVARAQGIILSAGHSNAGYEAMRQAVRLGVSQVTHAFNAMPGIHHRRPGLLTEALLNPDISLELIADGVHIHPAVLELALRLKPAEKVALVSDGTRAVGMPDGTYELGGQLTTVKAGVATLADGTIAGSAFPLLKGVQTLVKHLGYPLPEAVRYASLNPARLLGIDHRLGSIAIGKEATFIRLDSSLNVKQVWLRGILTEKGR